MGGLFREGLEGGRGADGGAKGGGVRGSRPSASAAALCGCARRGKEAPRGWGSADCAACAGCSFASRWNAVTQLTSDSALRAAAASYSDRSAAAEGAEASASAAGSAVEMNNKHEKLSR